MVMVAMICGLLTFRHAESMQNDLAKPLADIFTGVRMVIVHLVREHKDMAVLYTTKLLSIVPYAFYKCILVR